MTSASETEINTETTSQTTDSVTETTEVTTVKITTTTQNGETPSVMIGDVNLDGRIDITDAVLLNKIVSGSVKANDQQTEAADCNGDNAMDTNDSLLLLKFLVHLVESIGPGAEA